MSVSHANTVAQPSLYDRWVSDAERLAIPDPHLGKMEDFLSDMKGHHPGTYEHSMRVGMIAPKIGGLVEELEGFSPKILFYAGTMHDMGKLKVPRSLLDKTTEWTEEDAEALKAHPLDSYDELIRDGMAVTAGAVVLHHTFQPDPYPAEPPEPAPHLPEHVADVIPVLGRVLALSDFYDASHRKDSDGNLSPDQIRTKIYKANPDLTELIDKLYSSGVFSTDAK